MRAAWTTTTTTEPAFLWIEPQNPRPDLPDWVRDFYKKHQGQIDRCINRIFGQLWDGTPDIAATVIPRQTTRNAPELDVSLTQFPVTGIYTAGPHARNLQLGWGSWARDCIHSEQLVCNHLPGREEQNVFP